MNSRATPLLIKIGSGFCPDLRVMEFHINGETRKKCDFDQSLYQSSGNVIFANIENVQQFAKKYNDLVDGKNHSERYLKTGQLNAMALIDEIFHYVCRLYRQDADKGFFVEGLSHLESSVGKAGVDRLLLAFTQQFPPVAVYQGHTSAELWLKDSDTDGTTNRERALEELMMLTLANDNPAFAPFYPLFDNTALIQDPLWTPFWDSLRSWSAIKPAFGPEGFDLISMLKAPVDYSPFDLKGQLDYIRTRWGTLLGDWLMRLLSSLDLIAEENKPGWAGLGDGSIDMDPYDYTDISREYERFSPDRDWMPNVVLMAKSALVWLSQLSRTYGRAITRLDQIPDEELDSLARAGFTGLWLIGLWERSPASARIKQICGNPEAAASAYSLDDYEIARELGGWEALDNLRTRAWKRGIRMASDMVPNHTGMDSNWVVEKPDLFIQATESPFPGYDFSGEDLSHDGRVGIFLENHYYSKSDCAVVFKRVDKSTGDTRYIYHGNDGTGMPWNDTAQIDFLNPTAREEVIQKILHVARNFPIIRFDAAMVLAKKHIQRLWYPEPGKGGDIASRSRYALSRAEFEHRIPEEFWREVVDRCAKEIPDTLLLAEAFWMMEGYFVRTLGMHRVYNSAFMNMLKREDNEKYRTTIKNTIEFDPEILKRYVNFMNNPDEETAVAQFGKGDKYFGICTMMVAMPGLPMFGHGQIEGFEEKYGMEYRKAYRDEAPDKDLVRRHEREIFPLMKKRWLFAGVENFCLFDFWDNGHVNENVFAWSNRAGTESALILFNNVYGKTAGWIKTSAAFAKKTANENRILLQKTIAEALGLGTGENLFCLMQEQRSGLWYLRTSNEIHANGLWASLNGFETQVFLNIREVEDEADGRYRTLYRSLNGKGVRDIHMALQAIVYADLYAALDEVLTPLFYSYFKTVCLPDSALSQNSESGPELPTNLKQAVHAFYHVASTRLNTTANDAGVNKATLTFMKFLSRLEKLCRRSSRTEQGPLVTIKGFPEALAASSIILALSDILPKANQSLALPDVIGQWSLDRRIADRYEEINFVSYLEISEFRTHISLWAALEPLVRIGAHKGCIQAIITFISRLCAPQRAARNVVKQAITTLAGDTRVQREIRLHTWDGVAWFDKEKAETLVHKTCTASLVFGPVKKVDRFERVAIAYLTNSEYRFEKLTQSVRY